MSETGETPKVPKTTRRRVLKMMAGVGGAAILASSLPQSAEAKENNEGEIALFRSKTEQITANTQFIVPTSAEKIEVNHFKGGHYLIDGLTSPEDKNGRKRSLIDVYTPNNSKEALDYAFFLTADEVGRRVNILNNSYPANQMNHSYKVRTGRDLDRDFEAAYKYFKIENYVTVPNDYPTVPIIPSPSEEVQRYSRSFSILKNNSGKLLELLAKASPKDIKEQEIVRNTANIFLTALKLTFDCKSMDAPISSLGFNIPNIKKLVIMSGQPEPFPLAA